MNSVTRIETAAVSPDSSPLPRAALSEFEATARAIFNKRVAGTKLGKIVASLPQTLENEVDALLDRAGLMRKVRLDAPKASVSVDAAVVDGATATVEVGARP